VRSHFELTPAEYEARRQGHLQRRRAELVGADVTARAREGDLVVELGCGPGDVLAYIARKHPEVEFLGVDIDGAMVEHARSAHAAPNLTFRRADVADGVLDGHARVVFGIDVLHHVHELRPFIEAVAALLGRTGWWTVIEPNSRNPYIWLHQERMRRAGLDEDHFRRGPFEHEVARSGLRVARRRTAFVVPGFVRSVPGPLVRAETLLERVPVLGGSVVYGLSPS
jgi:trans-aconitate methyltransferase